MVYQTLMDLLKFSVIQLGEKVGNRTQYVEKYVEDLATSLATTYRYAFGSNCLLRWDRGSDYAIYTYDNNSSLIQRM